jgi:hypothetical protein
MDLYKDDYNAQVVDIRSYSQEKIIALMLKRETSLTFADTTAVLEVYTEVIADIVADGEAVHTVERLIINILR